MLPLLFAAALALSLPPQVFVFEKPPDTVWFVPDDTGDITTFGDRHSQRLSTEQLRALITMFDRA